MDAQRILENVRTCQSAMEKVARGPVEIMAVTKTQSAETANAVWAAGIRKLGENRVQELLEKFPALNPGFSVELIGQLQTNKVKYTLDNVARVQSLDRMALALEIDRRAGARGRVMPCLVEVNIAREPQRGGVMEEDLEAFVRDASKLENLRVEGLMAVMPITKTPEQARPYFRRMHTWFERLRDAGIPGAFMECLSMGMSGDYLMAAEEGSTLVRLGSAIFGYRT